ncbi:DNA segregation ATPase FtsK/SpoIIIE, S-DNA-T family, partial [Lachnospiraceae bacterium C7]
MSSVTGSGASHVSGLEETQEEGLASVVPETMAMLPSSLATILFASSSSGSSFMEYLQEDEQNLGFSIIYTTDNEANLPENIHTIVLLENSKTGRLLINEGVRVNRKFNLVKQEKDVILAKDEDLEKSARKLSAIEHEEGISSRIPESVTF